MFDCLLIVPAKPTYVINTSHLHLVIVSGPGVLAYLLGSKGFQDPIFADSLVPSLGLRDGVPFRKHRRGCSNVGPTAACATTEHQ